ncbi:C2H2 finger domain protein [Fonsecaea pedrosoi]|nr:C2H2 finger domain protein [Fonsecaea pedrosoi]
MAPKQRSQTPRQPGVANSSESILHHPQATTTLFSEDEPAHDRRRRRQRDSPRPASYTQSPSQDTIALSRSPIVSDSPASPLEGSAQGFTSRRESSSTMRTSSISLDMVPTCTPTGRISKAKKGKRVHACVETPKIPRPQPSGPRRNWANDDHQVFTRAEHRRRHELNHNPEALFPCTRPGCRKAFHRMDLLQRHQERHDLETAAEATVAGHMNQMAQVAVTSEPSSVMPAPVMTSPQADRSAPRSSSGGLSIGSLVHPQQDYRYGMGTPAFNGFPRQQMHYVPGYNSADDSIFYTPESSQSPVSEYYGRFPHRQSISSSSSVAAFDPRRHHP